MSLNTLVMRIRRTFFNHRAKVRIIVFLSKLAVTEAILCHFGSLSHRLLTELPD